MSKHIRSKKCSKKRVNPAKKQVQFHKACVKGFTMLLERFGAYELWTAGIKERNHRKTPEVFFKHVTPENFMMDSFDWGHVMEPSNISWVQIHSKWRQIYLKLHAHFHKKE